VKLLPNIKTVLADLFSNLQTHNTWFWLFSGQWTVDK